MKKQGYDTMVIKLRPNRRLGRPVSLTMASDAGSVLIRREYQ